MSLGWPGNASGSPRKSWRKWPGTGTSGLLCSSCCPRDPTAGEAADNGWMNGFYQFSHRSCEAPIVFVAFPIIIDPSIHPLSAASPGVGSRGQQLEQRSPDIPVPGHFFQLFRGDPEAFPGEPKDIVSPTCPGFSPGSPPSETCPEHLTREASRRHPNQMPEPPHLAPLDAEEQRFYSEPLPDD